MSAQYAGATGYQRDAADLGLDYLYQRYYDPAVGRFVTRDPIRWAGGLNLYGYTENDPVNKVDPSGLDAGWARSPYWNDPYGFVAGRWRKSPGYFWLRKLRLVSVLLGGRDPMPPPTMGELVARIPQACPSTGMLGAALLGVPGGDAEEALFALESTAIDAEVTSEAESAPTESYNRLKHYGRTPTQADKRIFGPWVEHDPPLVERYYNGDPTIGEKPGHEMTQAERRASATDRLRMRTGVEQEQRTQGAEMSRFSREMKKRFNLK